MVSPDAPVGSDLNLDLLLTRTDDLCDLIEPPLLAEGLIDAAEWLDATRGKRLAAHDRILEGDHTPMPPDPDALVGRKLEVALVEWETSARFFHFTRDQIGLVTGISVIDWEPDPLDIATRLRNSAQGLKATRTRAEVWMRAYTELVRHGDIDAPVEARDAVFLGCTRELIEQLEAIKAHVEGSAIAIRDRRWNEEPDQDQHQCVSARLGDAIRRWRLAARVLGLNDREEVWQLVASIDRDELMAPTMMRRLGDLWHVVTRACLTALQPDIVLPQASPPTTDTERAAHFYGNFYDPGNDIVDARIGARVEPTDAISRESGQEGDSPEEGPEWGEVSMSRRYNGYHLDDIRHAVPDRAMGVLADLESEGGPLSANALTKAIRGRGRRISRDTVTTLLRLLRKFELVDGGKREDKILPWALTPVGTSVLDHRDEPTETTEVPDVAGPG